jgi:hypothetical protein
MDRLEIEPEFELDDIDWDEIIDSTQADIEAGNYAFTTDGCRTDEEVMQAVWNWLCTLGHGGTLENTDQTELHATRP